MADILEVSTFSDFLASRDYLDNQDRDDVVVSNGGLLLNLRGEQDIMHNYSALCEQGEALVSQALYLELLAIIWEERLLYVLKMRALAEYEPHIERARTAPTETGEDLHIVFERWDDARAGFAEKVESALSHDAPIP